MNNFNAQNTQVLEIKTSKGIKYISQNRIVYIKAENKGTNINLNNSEKVYTKHLLKWYNKYLKSPIFFRCHNSYIVNCIDVECHCSSEIILKEQIRIPLSRNKKQSFKENLILLEKVMFCNK